MPDSMPDCLFCKIVANLAPSFKIWEDSEHLAFLTPFPNTPGFSVVIPKAHYPSYGFAATDEVLTKLVVASKQVAILIDKNLGVARTGFMMEGFGIDHLHMKLFPMHGIEQTTWLPISSTNRTFYEKYAGFIASHDGPRMDDKILAELATKIRG